MTNLIPLFQLAVSVDKDTDSGEYVVTGATGKPKAFKTVALATAHLSAHLALVSNALLVKGIADGTLNDVEPRK
jgi:hypothetical protein